jgi:hypothetical protein
MTESLRLFYRETFQVFPVTNIKNIPEEGMSVILSPSVIRSLNILILGHK